APVVEEPQPGSQPLPPSRSRAARGARLVPGAREVDGLEPDSAAGGPRVADHPASARRQNGSGSSSGSAPPAPEIASPPTSSETFTHSRRPLSNTITCRRFAENDTPARASPFLS